MSRFTKNTCPKSDGYFETGNKCGDAAECKNCKVAISAALWAKGKLVVKKEPVNEKNYKAHGLPVWWQDSTMPAAKVDTPTIDITICPLPMESENPSEEFRVVLSLQDVESLLIQIIRQDGSEHIDVAADYSVAWMRGFNYSRENLIENIKKRSVLNMY